MAKIWGRLSITTLKGIKTLGRIFRGLGFDFSASFLKGSLNRPGYLPRVRPINCKSLVNPHPLLAEMSTVFSARGARSSAR